MFIVPVYCLPQHGGLESPCQAVLSPSVLLLGLFTWCPLVRVMAAILLSCHHPLGLPHFIVCYFSSLYAVLLKIFSLYIHIALPTLEVYSPHLPLQARQDTHGHLHFPELKSQLRYLKGLAQLSPFPDRSGAGSRVPRPRFLMLFPPWQSACLCGCCFLQPCLDAQLLSRPHGLQTARLLCPWNSPGKSTGVGCHALLQGIFPTQRLNPGLSHCRWILYQFSHKGNPNHLKAVVIFNYHFFT